MFYFVRLKALLRRSPWASPAASGVHGTKMVKKLWSEETVKILEPDPSRFNLAKGNRLQTVGSKP